MKCFVLEKENSETQREKDETFLRNGFIILKELNFCSYIMHLFLSRDKEKWASIPNVKWRVNLDIAVINFRKYFNYL